jgi:hypothetical protein
MSISTRIRRPDRRPVTTLWAAQVFTLTRVTLDAEAVRKLDDEMDEK